MNIYEFLLVFSASLIILLLARQLFGLILSPVRGGGCRAEVTVYATGTASGLEQTLRAALKLASRGGIGVTLIDCGLDEDALAVAKGLAYGGRIKITRKE